MANYFKSTDVKIFPCAYRGQNASNEPINPEASSFTEYNFTNIYSKQGDKKESFIISYTENELKCVIGGYYFEITNFNEYKESDYKYLAIKIANKELIPFDGTDSAGSLDDTTNNIFLGVAGGNSLDELSGCSASLQIFDSYEETIGDSTNTTYKLCESSKRLEDIIGAGKGKYSIGSYYADNNQLLLNTAGGKHSIAFGEKVAAKNDYAIVLGDKLESSAANQIILGTGVIKNTNEVTTADPAATIQVFKAGESIYKLENNGNEIISGNIKTNGIEETDKVSIKKPTEITKTLNVAEKITANGELEVAKKTTLKDQLVVENAAEIKDALTLTITKSGAKTTITTINKDGIKTTKSIVAADKITSKGDLSVERTATITGKITAANVVLNGTNTDYIAAGDNKLDKDGNLTIAGDITSKSLKVETTDGATKITLDGDSVIDGDLTVNNKLTSAYITEDTDNKTLKLTAGTINAEGSALTIKNLNLEKGIKISVSDKEYNDLVPSTQTNGLKVKNTNAICFNTGIDTLGPITVCRNDSTKKYAFAAFEPDKKSITSGVSFDGTAYFKQRLVVGGDNTNLDIAENTAASSLIGKLSTGCILYAGAFGTAIKDKLAVGGNTYFGGDVEINSDKAMTFGSNIKINESGEGRIVACGFGTSSDFRLKQNIKSYKAEKSILDLDVKEFEYINDTAHKKHIGAIAQDVQEICPEIVYEDTNGYLNIEENKLVYLLLNEVKELKKEIKRLKGE